MRAIVVVRPVESLEVHSVEPAAAAYRKYPRVPAGWDVVCEIDGWSSIYPLGRITKPNVFIHAWLAVEDAGQGAFVVAGPDAILRQIHQTASRAWTIAQFRADNGAAASRIKSLWKDDRPRDGAGNPIGVRVAMRHTMAGFDYGRDLENTTGLP